MAAGKNMDTCNEDIWEDNFPSEDSYSEGTSGPSTPIKQRLQIDFWGKKEKVTKKEVTISELHPGPLSNEDLMFRVTYSGKPFVSKSGYKVHTFFGLGIDNSEISFVSFGNTAKKMHDLVKENFVYVTNNFVVKTSQDNYRKCGNNLEIRLQSDSEITEIPNCDGFPPIPFNFKTVKEIKNFSAGAIADVLGIVALDFGCEEITKTFDGKERKFKKRDLLITDDTEETVLLTLWSPLAENLAIALYGTIAVRNAEVYQISGTLALKFSDKAGTYVKTNPSTEAAMKMKTWFDKVNPHRD